MAAKLLFLDDLFEEAFIHYVALLLFLAIFLPRNTPNIHIFLRNPSALHATTIVCVQHIQGGATTIIISVNTQSGPKK